MRRITVASAIAALVLASTAFAISLVTRASIDRKVRDQVHAYVAVHTTELRGPQGLEGPRGVAGRPGPKGDTGQSGVVVVVTTPTTAAALSQAAVPCSVLGAASISYPACAGG